MLYVVQLTVMHLKTTLLEDQTEHFVPVCWHILRKFQVCLVSKFIDFHPCVNISYTFADFKKFTNVITYLHC